MKEKKETQTAQDFCAKHEMAVTLTKWKDGSHTIHVSNEGTLKQVAAMLLQIFGSSDNE